MGTHIWCIGISSDQVLTHRKIYIWWSNVNAAAIVNGLYYKGRATSTSQREMGTNDLELPDNRGENCHLFMTVFTVCKKSASWHHWTTLLSHIFATKARIDNWEKSCYTAIPCPHVLIIW